MTDCEPCLTIPQRKIADYRLNMEADFIEGRRGAGCRGVLIPDYEVED